MKKYGLYILGICFVIQVAWAGQSEYKNRIIETKTCASIMTVLCDHTVHIQDLDNTIMETVQTLGSDQWYGDLVARFIAGGMSKSEAIEKAITQWVEVQEATQMKPVEDYIPNMISFLIQERDHLRDAALTARPPELADTTLKQLASMGIDFAKRNPFGGGKKVQINSPEFVEPVLIQGGVIFVGPKNEKGKVLAFLLDPKSGFNHYATGFERVVFADDKLHHNESILKELRARLPELDVYAFRVGAADERVKAYNRKIADFQWDEFKKGGKLVSDKEALERLNNPVPIDLLPPRSGLKVDANVLGHLGLEGK